MRGGLPEVRDCSQAFPPERHDGALPVPGHEEDLIHLRGVAAVGIDERYLNAPNEQKNTHSKVKVKQSNEIWRTMSRLV